MKTIPLSQGLFAMVDDADYEAVNAHKWCATKLGRGFYAVRTFREPDGKKTSQLLHHFLMPGVRVDHRDGNGLNNQRENLRPATVLQNQQGFRRKALGTTSRYRGVYWHAKLKKWQASIKVKGVPIYLGVFMEEKDAAHAYDSAALLYFGEWASPNFPVGGITIT